MVIATLILEITAVKCFSEFVLEILVNGSSNIIFKNVVKPMVLATSVSEMLLN